MKPWRIAGVSGFWLTCTLAATLGSLLLATAVQPHPVAGPPLRLGSGGFSPGGAGRLRFAPLSPRILSGVPGLAGIESALGAPPSPPSETADDAPGSRPSRSHSPSPSPSPGPVADGPDLRVDMTVDHTVARPGDIVNYSITVRNTGSKRADGVTVSSHIPEHTTQVSSGECGSGNVSVEPNDGGPAPYGVCTDVPGPPAPGEHGFVDTGRSFEPGQQQVIVFKVQIDADAPDGAQLRNHAHASAPGVQRVTSNEVVTAVRYR